MTAVRTLDESTTAAHVRAAVAALKAIRGRTGALDRLVDAIEPRPVAHAAEEALRIAIGSLGLAPGLHRHTGESTDLITAALSWLNSSGLREVSASRTRLRAADGPGAVPHLESAVAGEGVGR